MARWWMTLGCLVWLGLSHADPLAVAARVEGAEIATLVTPEAIAREMKQDLRRAGIPIAEAPSPDTPTLLLSFTAQVLEPSIPDPEEPPHRIVLMSVHLDLREPVESAGHPIHASTWQTHVQAWALEGKLQAIACVAIRKALGRFIEAYSG